jgi:outer membrane murein-binding lipoprotein Lpp
MRQTKLVKSDVASALSAYAGCIQGSDGHDDCSSEFSTLHSAQDDFESAVSEYESECQ